MKHEIDTDAAAASAADTVGTTEQAMINGESEKMAVEKDS